MNKPTRIVAGIFGVIAMIYGIYQMKVGMFGYSRTPQEKGDRMTFTDPGYSLHVPKGWEQKRSTMGRGAMLTAPEKSGYSANLIVTEESPFLGTLREYADITLAGIKETMKDASVTGEAPFPTDAGLPALRVTLRNKDGEKEVTQILYFFDAGSDQKFLAIASVFADQAGDLMPLFDACLRTLEVK